MNWQDRLRASAAEVPPDELPDLVGELARQEVLARQRLAGDNGVGLAPESGGPALERLLTVEEVAEGVGASPRWVRRHRECLGGRKLDGLLRFSQKAVQRYIDAAPAR